MEEQSKNIYINVSDSKNVVTGNIDSGGGDINIGDTIINEAPKPLPKALTSIPTRDPKNLIGRKAFLAQLRDNLVHNKEVVLVNAMGGVGKTSIAEAYTAAYYDDYACMLWVQQGEGEDIRFSFSNDKALLQNLSIQPDGKKIDDLFIEVCNALRNISAQPKLLVIDNINQQVQEYWQQLPKPPNWHVLYTSREKLEDVKEMELDFLSQEDALALYNFYYGKEIDEEEIAGIIELFDRHTLTIEILAKAQKKNRYAPAELKAALQENITAGIKTKHSQQQKIDKVKSYLANIFKMSKLEEQEIWLLKQFACLPSAFHEFDILEELLTTEDFSKATLSSRCSVLHEKGWLLYNETEDSYKLHAIIQEVLVDEYPIEEEDVSELINRLTSALRIDQTKDNPVDKFPWIPYGEAILVQVSDETEAISTLENNLGLRLQDLGDYEGAKAYLEKALSSARKHFGEDHPSTAISYSNLATVLQDLGDYEGAKAYLEKALSSDRKHFGEDHPSTAIRYSNLALVLKDLGDYEGAKAYLEKALSSDRKHFGEDHPSTAIRYSNLALVLQDLGDYEGAKAYLEKALSSARKHFGEDHPSTAIRYSNLATVLQALGDYEGAKAYLEKALSSDRKHFGEDHPSTARSYSNLALVLKALGDYEGAKAYLEKALSSARKHFGEDHPSTAIRYSNLATVLKALGDYEGAKAYLEKALSSDRKHFGEDHPSTAIRYSNLALVLQDLGDYEGAKGYLEKVLLSDQKTYGEEHPSTARSYSNLGSVLQDLGDYEGAKQYLEKALLSDRKIYGEDHPSTAIKYYNLGTMHHNLGEKQKALALIEKAHVIFLQNLPAGHPYINLTKGWIDGINKELKGGQ